MPNMPPITEDDVRKAHEGDTESEAANGLILFHQGCVDRKTLQYLQQRQLQRIEQQPAKDS